MLDSPIPLSLQGHQLWYQINKSFEDAISEGNVHQATAIVAWALSFEEGRTTWKKISGLPALVTALDPEKRSGHTVDSDLIRLLLDTEIPVNDLFSNKPSPLRLAIRSGSLLAVQMLLERGAEFDSIPPHLNLKTQQKDASAALVFAIEEGQSEIALHLLQMGADPHGFQSEVRPLQAAARYGDLQVTQTLLDIGVDPNWQDEKPGPQSERYPRYNSTDTALMEAAKVDANPVLDLLLSHGVTFNARNHDGLTALEFAAYPCREPITRRQGIVLRAHHSYAPTNLRRLLQCGFERNRISKALAPVQLFLSRKIISMLKCMP